MAKVAKVVYAVALVKTTVYVDLDARVPAREAHLSAEEQLNAQAKRLAECDTSDKEWVVVEIQPNAISTDREITEGALP